MGASISAAILHATQEKAPPWRHGGAGQPQPDQIAPTREDVERLLVFGREVSETPEAHLLVHCRAGVSSSTAAAALILMQANPEWPASAALDAVPAIRPRA